MRQPFALLSLLLAAPVLGATTWTTDTSQPTNQVRVVKMVNDVAGGTETKPSDADATAGIALHGVRGLEVVAIATGGAMTAGGKLIAYVYDPISTKWVPNPDNDIVVPAATEHLVALEVLVDWDRIAFIPSGIGRASTIYLKGRLAPAR